MPDDLPALLDQALRSNPHYDYCRSLGQLQPPAVFFIRGNAYERYTSELQKSGMRLGDIRPAALSTTDNWAWLFGGSSFVAGKNGAPQEQVGGS